MPVEIELAIERLLFNVGQDGRAPAGMGATAADFNGRGMLDIFKTNFADDTHSFYRNLGKNEFEDATIASRGAERTPAPNRSNTRAASTPSQIVDNPISGLATAAIA